MIIVPLSVIALLFLANKKVIGKNKKTLFDPVSCFLLIWFFAFILHFFHFGVHDYTLTGYLIILLSCSSLCVGYWAFSRFRNDKQTRTKEYNIPFLNRLLLVLTIVEAIRLILYYYYVIHVLAGGLGYFIANGTEVRNKYLFTSAPSWYNVTEFLLNINAMVGYVLLGIHLAKNKKRSKYLILIIWAIVEFLSAYFTNSKLSFVAFVFVVCFSFFNNVSGHRAQLKKAAIILPVALLASVVLFLALGKLRNYGEGDSLLRSVWMKIIDYFAGPIEALCKLVNTNSSDLGVAENTFAFVFRILSRLGLTEKSFLHSQNFIEIGDSMTNVYTWCKPFYLDLSVIGCFIYPLAIGSCSALLMRGNSNTLTQSNSLAWIGMCLSLSFFTFMWEYTIYIAILFYGAIVDRLFSKTLYLYEKKQCFVRGNNCIVLSK